MISFGTTAISALSPWLLTALPLAAGLLVYVYRKRGSSMQRVVSSLFLLRNLPRATPGRRRFVPPVQFWIELTLFTLLACAAATLVLNKQGEHVAVVIDNSFSMSAVDRAGASRLERIKSLARADISQTLKPLRFTVFAAHSSLDAASTRGTSSPAALTAVATVEQALSADKLSLHLESLLSQGTFDAVWVYTDHPLKDGVVPQRTRVVTIPSEPLEKANVSLSSITVRQIQGESAISGRVDSSHQAALRVTVAATCFDTSSRFELPPLPLSLEARKSSSFQVPIGSREWSYCRLNVNLPPDTFDALAGDNESWVTNNSTQSAIKVVSPLSAEELGLTKIKTLTFSKDLASASVATVFHRTSPDASASQSSSLAIFPPAGKLIQGGFAHPEITSAEVTRWNTSHPILTYVNPSLIKIPLARRLTCPESATPILFSQTGPLACAGESNGVRYAVVGFELFPFDGKKTPTLSILTLNLLSWVSQQTGLTVQGVSPGVVALPAGTRTVNYVAPSKESLPLSEGSVAVVAPHPGILELQVEGKTTHVAVVTPSDSESALSQVSILELPQTDSEPKKKDESESTDLTPWLALIALGALVLDLLRRLIRKQRWVAS